MIAVCRWVDTSLPPNRRLCLKFWGVPSNKKRQVRFVSGFAVDGFAVLNHAFIKANSLRSTYMNRSILYKYPSHFRIRCRTRTRVTAALSSVVFCVLAAVGAVGPHLPLSSPGRFRPSLYFSHVVSVGRYLLLTHSINFRLWLKSIRVIAKS